jgi:4-hydroxy-3-methylbut-2-enyl diphosphate reductase
MGVERSIGMAVEAREKIEGELTILNEIVHNNSVVRDLDNRGIHRTTNIDEVKNGTLIISAHGVAPFVIDDAQNKGLNVIDSTCPLVTVLHKSADYFIKRGYTVIVFGDPKHDEMQGVRGRNPEKIYVIKEISSPDDLPEIEGKVALISQSTQSLEMFDKAAEVVERKYDNVKIKNTICDATRKRQTAILDLAPEVDLVLVVGSQTSANSKRLVLIAEQTGTPAYLIDNSDDIDENWIKNVDNVGITAGASTPDKLVQEVVNRLTEFAIANGIKEVNIYNGKDEEETEDQSS